MIVCESVWITYIVVTITCMGLDVHLWTFVWKKGFGFFEGVGGVAKHFFVLATCIMLSGCLDDF